MVWTTAQGRFGRALHATGIQHPAPTLICTVDRDENKVWVSAPYAVAVLDGKQRHRRSAAHPALVPALRAGAPGRQPRSRNILLDDKQLDWRLEIEEVPDRNRFLQYDDAQRRTLKNLTVRNFKDDLSYAKAAGIYKLAETNEVEQRRGPPRHRRLEQQRSRPVARALRFAGRLAAQRAGRRISARHHEHLLTPSARSTNKA